MKLVQLGHYTGGGGVDVQGPQDWFGDDLVFWLAPHRLSTLMVEQANSGVPITDVTDDGNSVGTVYEQGHHGFLVRAESDARRPILGSDANRNAYLTFDGTDDYLRVVSTTKYFNALHKASPVWSMAILVKMGASTDGAATQYFLSNHASTTAQAGIVVSRNNANKIVLLGSKASAGNNVFSYTSTATLTEASGWTLIMIEVNGTGAAAGRIKVGSAAWETFNVNAGAAVDATADLHIGALNSPASYFKGSIGGIIILNRTLTVGDITNIEGYNPAKFTGEFTPILQWDLDFDADARIFSDSAATTPIVDDSLIRVVQSNQDSIFGPLNRTITSAADASSPEWRDAEKNGKATAEFNPANNDNFDFPTGNGLTQESGGKWTIFIIAKNDDAINGSHVVSGSGYVPITGSGYSGNSNNGGVPYFTIHPSTGSGQAEYNDLVNIEDGYNILVLQRDGATWSAWNGAGVKNTSATNSNSFLITDIGIAVAAIGATWNMDGMYCRLIKYNGVMSPSEVLSKITEYNTLYAL